MKRQLGIALLGALLLSVGCNPIKRLSDTEWDHYRALRVYMSEDERNAFLKNKTEEERNEFLQALGLWDRFYQYPEDVRELILSGDVARGWTKDKLLMAWGRPYDMQKLAGRDTYRSERYIYRFEEHEGGRLIIWAKGSKTAYKAIRIFERTVILDDDVVAEIKG